MTVVLTTPKKLKLSFKEVNRLASKKGPVPLSYTGIPDPGDNPHWIQFWLHKLAMLGRQGAVVFSRSLPYRNQRVRLPDGTEHTCLAGEEKGIDVRIV